MTLTEYFSSLPRGAKVLMAKELKITKTWVSLVVSGRKQASPQLAIAIEKYTRLAVKRGDLRPDIFEKNVKTTQKSVDQTESLMV